LHDREIEVELLCHAVIAPSGAPSDHGRPANPTRIGRVQVFPRAALWSTLPPNNARGCVLTLSLS
jgi:hypothetical protein